MSEQTTAEPETGKRDASAAGSEFSRQAEQRQSNIVSEFASFLMHNKKWWLAPIIIMLLLFGLLIVFAGTGAAPFIYTLF